MKKVKEPSVANMFYSADKEELKNQIENFRKNNKNGYEYQPRAVIVPHAGLIYSGKLAFETINQLDKDIENIFIFAPAHKVAFQGISLTSYDEWKTPLGNIEINQEINKELAENFGGNFFDEGYKEEHSVEIQVPLIQSIFKNIKIIPVLVGNETPQKITDIIKKYYTDKKNGFIISSDMSHFLDDETAKKLDNETAQMIETGDIQNFKFNQACGAIGIFGLVTFANENNFSLIRINMYNSSSVSGEKSRVVGYGAWFLYEGEKNKFIKKYYSKYMLDLCYEVIKSRFNNNKVQTNHTPVFDEMGACFVTLKKQGSLRGCIGSIIAHQPLIVDLVQHAQDSAFNDYRFNPLEEFEINDLTMDISLLSTPKPMSFKNEEDLLEQMVPYKDGIIIRDGNYQAVYLPSVWEEIPDKKTFLTSLKIKAGMPPDYFSENFKAYRFETEYIEQK